MVRLAIQAAPPHTKSIDQNPAARQLEGDTNTLDGGVTWVDLGKRCA